MTRGRGPSFFGPPLRLRPVDRDLSAELVGLALGLGGLALFLGIVDAVEAFQEPEELTAFDLAVADWVAAHVAGPVFTFALILAYVGSFVVVIAFVVLAALFSWRRGHRLEAAAVAGGAVLLQILVMVLKHAFGRVRPDVGLVVESGLSFPSGHAAFGAYLAAVMVWFALRYGSRWPYVVVVAASAATWALLQALGRVLLGVHYVSDVLAGLGVGFMVGGLGLALAPFAGRIVAWYRRAAAGMGA